MKVKLCAGCIKDLKDYNPYTVPIEIIKVRAIKDCDNFNIDNWNETPKKERKEA